MQFHRGLTSAQGSCREIQLIKIVWMWQKKMLILASFIVYRNAEPGCRMALQSEPSR